ncbi:MAG: periplasmic heavy metal sensor [Pseudomonadota bacterium]
MSTNENDTSQATPPRWRRWIWPVLVVSLGLNLLFVGLVAGRMWARLDGPPGAPHRIVTRAVEQFSGELPATKKERANALLQKQRDGNKALRRQLRQARRAAKEAALATTYDEKKLADALTRLREVRTSQHQAMHAMVLELLKDLSLEERKVLLKYIQKAFRPHHRSDRPRGRRGNGEGKPTP